MRADDDRTNPPMPPEAPAGAPPEASASWPSPSDAATPAGGRHGIVDACLVLFGMLAATCLVGFIAVSWLISNSTKPPDPVAPPVLWSTHDIVLSGSQPAVHGRLTITARRDPLDVAQVGLNAGVPASLAAAASPGAPAAPSAAGDADAAPTVLGSPVGGLNAALAAPTVRLTVTDDAGVVGDCVAACELAIAQFLCAEAACTTVYDVTVALVDAGPDTTAVHVSVAGGGDALRSSGLPTGFAVDLSFDAPAAPGGS